MHPEEPKNRDAPALLWHSPCTGLGSGQSESGLLRRKKPVDDYSLNGIYSDLMRIYNAQKWDMNGIHGGFHGILGYYIKGYSLQYSNHGKSLGNPRGVEGQIRKTLGLSIAIDCRGV